MSPGINDHPRNTGALPKSNIYTNRNRERDRSSINQISNYGERSHPLPAQHANNLFQLDWHPVSERQTTSSNAIRAAKNSNTRSTYPTVSSYCCSDIGPYSVNTRLNLHIDPRQELTSWMKMPTPVNSRTQSPTNDAAKPTNTDKMPERGQVEGRLHQIREYIKITSTMMDSLNQSSDSRAQAQHEKLSKMVEDLYDSEQKLSKLMEECQKYWKPNENGELENDESHRELDLRKKVEESQRKLAQLQEHQAHLVGMQLRVRERLNEARQAQRALLAEEANEVEGQEPQMNEANEEAQKEAEATGQSSETPTVDNVERLERETDALRNKLEQLENKKKHMDHLVQELEAIEFSDRASCSSDNSRLTGQRDKVAELQTLKSQLSHLKALMDEATRCRDGTDLPQLSSDPEHEDDTAIAPNGVNSESKIPTIYDQLEESVSDLDLLEHIRGLTSDITHQQTIIQFYRTVFGRFKQGTSSSVPSLTSSTPSLVLNEKKQSNNVVSNQRRQLEDFAKKDPSNDFISNQNEGQEWSSQRNSNSLNSHSSTPANIWISPANIENCSHEHSVDGISASENLSGMGSQSLIENGFGGNFWEMPTALSNQPPQGAVVGSAQYYKQLLLGSQAQQLQMMNTTIQQCCQLLWSQQREMQSMKSAIVQLQAQFRHSQSRSSNNLELHEEQHSNLGRAAAQQHFGSLDTTTLPPSSSLPNLVSLPSNLPTSQPLVVSTLANCQQQQQQHQQLNNQVPPGNRANNYWDNFRSYSRQNLLSESSKTTTDCSVSTTHAVLSSNSANGVIISHMNKCNRQHGLENLPMPITSDTQYSLNLQPCTSHLQQQDIALRNNCIPSHEASLQQQQQQQPQQHQHQQPQQLQQQQHQQPPLLAENIGEEATESRPLDDGAVARRAKNIMSQHKDIKLILMYCLKVLESNKQNENSLPSLKYLRNSSFSSDDESEVDARGNTIASVLSNSNKTNAGTQTCIDVIESAQNFNSTQHILDQVEFSDGFSNETYTICLPSISSSTKDINEDAIESESSNSNHQPFS